MAKKFEHGETVYLPVIITNTEPDHGYDYRVSFNDFVDNAECTVAVGESQIKTAEEIAGPFKTKADAMTVTADSLQEENKKLETKVERLTTWYEEANKTASEAVEANDELKAKIAELKARNTELEALLKEVTATRDEAIKQNNALVEENDKVGKERDQRNHDVLVMKKDRDRLLEDNKKWKAKYDELKVRYDELDSVNKEQAEKIRKLGEALSDYKHMNNKLRDENTNLTFLLEDAPEKDKKELHVALNDGTEIEFERYTSYDYRTDVDMFVVKDGEKYIAGFMRGDKPGNLAYWVGE